MTAQFRWAKADYMSARWAWLRHHPVKLVLRYWYPIAILVVVGFAAPAHPEYRSIYALFVLFAVLIFVVVAFMQRWTWLREFRKTPLWRDNITANVDGEGIKLTDQTFQAVHSWGEFTDVYESARVILFEKGRGFIFLPKAGLGEAQLPELRALVSAHARCKVKLQSSFA